jgi:hypothetical protein
VVLRADVSPGYASASFFSASDSATFDDYFNFRVALASGRQEFAVQTAINANILSGVNRRITADKSFHILALEHSGFELRVHKDGTVDPIVLDHGLEAAEGAQPYVRPEADGLLDGTMHAINSVVIGAISLQVQCYLLFCINLPV